MIRDGSGPKACHFFIKEFVTELYDLDKSTVLGRWLRSLMASQVVRSLFSASESC